MSEKTYSAQEALAYIHSELQKLKPEIDKLAKAQPKTPIKEEILIDHETGEGVPRPGGTKSPGVLPNEKPSKKLPAPGSGEGVSDPARPVKSLKKAVGGIRKIRGAYTGRSMGRADGALKKAPGMAAPAAPKMPSMPKPAMPAAPTMPKPPKMAMAEKDIKKNDFFGMKHPPRASGAPAPAMPTAPAKPKFGLADLGAAKAKMSAAGVKPISNLGMKKSEHSFDKAEKTSGHVAVSVDGGKTHRVANLVSKVDMGHGTYHIAHDGDLFHAHYVPKDAKHGVSIGEGHKDKRSAVVAAQKHHNIHATKHGMEKCEVTGSMEKSEPITFTLNKSDFDFESLDKAIGSFGEPLEKAGMFPAGFASKVKGPSGGSYGPGKFPAPQGATEVASAPKASMGDKIKAHFGKFKNAVGAGPSPKINFSQMKPGAPVHAAGTEDTVISKKPAAAPAVSHTAATQTHAAPSAPAKKISGTMPLSPAQKHAIGVSQGYIKPNGSGNTTGSHTTASKTPVTSVKSPSGASTSAKTVTGRSPKPVARGHFTPHASSVTTKQSAGKTVASNGNTQVSGPHKRQAALPHNKGTQIAKPYAGAAAGQKKVHASKPAAAAPAKAAPSHNEMVTEQHQTGEKTRVLPHELAEMHRKNSTIGLPKKNKGKNGVAGRRGTKLAQSEVEFSKSELDLLDAAVGKLGSES